MISMEMAEKISQIRKAKGLSMGKFAEELRVSQAHISKLESGKTRPSEMFLETMIMKYRVSADWLETGEGPIFKEEGSDESDFTVEELSFLAQLRKHPEARRLAEDAIRNDLGRVEILKLRMNAEKMGSEKRGK